MKKKIILFAGYFLLGLISYFSYIIIYNSHFDLGLFCNTSTECFSITKAIILFNWGLILVVIFAIHFLVKKKYLATNVLLVCLLFNIIKIGSGSAIPFLFVLNLFLLLIPFQILSNEKLKSLFIFNIIVLLFIYLFELINISELFYYNKSYSSLESILYIATSLFFTLNIAISFRTYKCL
jgi:hypothetical protein